MVLYVDLFLNLDSCHNNDNLCNKYTFHNICHRNAYHFLLYDLGLYNETYAVPKGYLSFVLYRCIRNLYRYMLYMYYMYAH